MNSTLRRWLSIDGLVAVLLGVTWLWFAWILAVSAAPMLLPSDPSPSVSTAWPAGQDARQNDNPVLFLLIMCLTLGSAFVTLADRARRLDRRPGVLLGLGGCAAAGMGFVAIQLDRFAGSAFNTIDRIEVVVLWNSANSLSIIMLAGLGLLVLSTVLMLVRHTGETPSLAEQVTTWHWHALDTFWLVLVALAWHLGVMEGL